MERQKLIKTIAYERLTEELEKENLRSPGIEAMADTIRALCNINEGRVEFDLLIKVANAYFGTEVFFDTDTCSLPPSIDALFMTSAEEDGRITSAIVIKRTLTPEQKKFRLCHEIGHLVCGPEKPLYQTEALQSVPKYYRYLKNENQANYFAGALLLSKNTLRDDLSKHKYDLELLADKYEVTYETIAHRTVVVSDLKLHFLKVSKSGEITKKYISSDESFNLNVYSNICKKTNAYSAFTNPKNDDVLAQYSSIHYADGTFIGPVLFCFTKLLNKHCEPVTITIGCCATDAKHFKYHKNISIGQVIPIHAHNCKNNCTSCSAKKHE